MSRYRHRLSADYCLVIDLPVGVLRKNAMRQNLGKRERLLRPLIAVGLAFFAASQVESGWLQGVLLTGATFLVLNGLLGRCYLWKALGINSARAGDPPCRHKLRSTSQCAVNRSE